MATPNLISIVNQFISPEVIDRIASALGMDRASIQKAINAGIPGILGALVSTLGRPGGAARIENALEQQEPGMLANMTNAIGTPQQGRAVEEGLGSLSSLLGGNMTSSLASALNRYAGLGDGTAKGILGMLTPLIMGILRQQGGNNASGIAQLLTSQKDNIARAMPAGFANYLSGTGVLDQLPGVSGAQARARSAYEDARTSSQENWLWPVLGLLALVGVGWYLLSRPADHNTARVTEPTTTTTPTTTAQSPMGTNTGSNFVVTESELASWTNKPVYSSDNKRVGEIAQLIRNPEDRVTDIYMDAEATMGLGAERYHITADQVREVKPDGIVLSLTETEVKQMEKRQEPASR
jgi:sporulation protein YlmC with PRC-barrel domain